MNWCTSELGMGLHLYMGGLYCRVMVVLIACMFNVSHDYQVIEEDLKPNGRNIDVTEANKKEYIE